MSGYKHVSQPERPIDTILAGLLGALATIFWCLVAVAISIVLEGG